MNRILARCGKPLHYKPPEQKQKRYNSDGETESESDDDEEEEEEEDRPFEPLKLWTSPHQGGEPIGLPPHAYVIVSPDFLRRRCCHRYSIARSLLPHIKSLRNCVAPPPPPLPLLDADDRG